MDLLFDIRVGENVCLRVAKLLQIPNKISQTSITQGVKFKYFTQITGCMTQPIVTKTPTFKQALIVVFI